MNFLNSSFDESRFNGDLTRLMLMAIMVHIYQDWGGGVGGIAMLLLCFVIAILQDYLRHIKKPPP